MSPIDTANSTSERVHPPRSVLFVPGSQPERFDKALASGAHAVIIDLEDAVAPDKKDEARRAVAAWVGKPRCVLVRVNARATAWFDEDVVLGRLAGVAGIVLPKTESAADLTDLVSRIKRKIPVYPLIESACGMANVLAIARAPFVRQLVFGTLDYMVDMNMTLENHELNMYRSRLVEASRLANILAPIDGVMTDIADVAQLTRETLNGKRWGFAGKLCIHPRQVSAINQAYAPSDAEIVWAQRALDASRLAHDAAIMLDGKMVDRPVVLRAQAILGQRMEQLARTS